MIKFTTKAFTYVVGIMIVLNYLVFPALTSANTILNLFGLFIILAIVILTLKFVLNKIPIELLDEDEIKDVHRIRTEKGKPTTLPDGLVEKEVVKPKRKYNRKPKQ
jgi:hypothetical protein